jgi:hypothetical protein
MSLVWCFLLFGLYNYNYFWYNGHFVLKQGILKLWGWSIIQRKSVTRIYWICSGTTMIPQLSIAKYSTIHLLLEYHQMKIISFLKLLYMTFGVYVFVVCYYLGNNVLTICFDRAVTLEPNIDLASTSTRPSKRKQPRNPLKTTRRLWTGRLLLRFFQLRSFTEQSPTTSST